MSTFEPEFWHHDKRLQEWEDAEEQQERDEREDKERGYGRLALTCLVLAVAAVTRSETAVAWTIVAVSAVWLASYYLTGWYRDHCAQMDRDIARALNDTEDPTALARAVGYHCLPLLTEERIREESMPLVVDAEWAAMNGDAS